MCKKCIALYYWLHYLLSFHWLTVDQPYQGEKNAWTTSELAVSFDQKPNRGIHLNHILDNQYKLVARVFSGGIELQESNRQSQPPGMAGGTSQLTYQVGRNLTSCNGLGPSVQQLLVSTQVLPN